VFSKAFLQELRPSRRYGAADLEESANYLDRDDTLLHLASSLVPSFSHSEPDQLFVDQLFLATSTYLVSKFGARVPLSSPKGRLAPRQEKMAKEFLDSNIRANVSLEEVANLCELSTPQFARLFKRSTGMTPYQWFIRRRLREAKFLLESSEDSLAEIGLACGFADQSHFTRTFSRLVGLSPGAWRRRERQ
jgi:AraC-like DNA-binding protein